ncbi:MAG TPA: hypothetical protein VMF30_19385 [Pirellulales bacterium]|nr:hypothetical protein [Pirellulales bacterium]
MPSMRELAKLEPAADASPVKVKTWGLRQGLMFLGMIIAGIGVLIGSYYSLVAMPSASELEPPANWHELPVEYAVSLWRELRRGMPQRPDPSLVGLVQQRDRAQRGVYVSWMVIATGGIIAASSFFVPRSRLRPQGPS